MRHISYRVHKFNNVKIPYNSYIILLLILQSNRPIHDCLVPRLLSMALTNQKSEARVLNTNIETNSDGRD